MKWLKLLVFCCFCQSLFGQTAQVPQPTEARTSLLLSRAPIRIGGPLPRVSPLPPGLTRGSTPGLALNPAYIPRWNASDLPVFCRIEHEIGRKLPITFKFRLGSVEYVDGLEGK